MSGRWFDCCKCREQIYLTDSQEDLLRKTQQEFFCRWGHKQHFPAGKTELQKAQDEVARITRERDLEKQRAARLREERDAADRRASAAKGQVTKLRNRAAAGVCPCCNRTFTQLARHMKAKHPTFSAEALN